MARASDFAIVKGKRYSFGGFPDSKIDGRDVYEWCSTKSFRLDMGDLIHQNTDDGVLRYVVCFFSKVHASERWFVVLGCHDGQVCCIDDRYHVVY